MKTPQPGEYWVSDDGSIIRIVGVKLNGGVIYENQAGFSFQFNSMIQWRHEPRCTSFDWVEPPAIEPGEGYEVLPDGEVLQEGDQFEAIGKWRNTNNAGRKKLPGWTYRRKIKPVETWPKYYICDTWVLAAYILRKSSGPLVIVNMDGSVEKPGRPWQEHDEYQYKHGFYREVTEAEALARVEPVKPPAEVWPKWYVATFHSCHYYRIDSCNVAWCISRDEETDSADAKRLMNNPDVWREVTEAEALARVKPDTSRPTNIHGTANDADETPEPCAMCGDVSCDRDCYKYAVEATGCPVESPDDLVEITNRDHKLRAGIDEFRNSHEWAYVRDSHGKTARQAGFLNVRCRRKDLPVLVTCTCPTLDGIPVTGSACPMHGFPSCELTTAPTRIPVRLWIDQADGEVIATTGNDYATCDAVEILHDADGFYVTEGER